MTLKADPQKYIVFKRAEFEKLFDDGLDELSRFELKDAVVIRRQDDFASPVLLTYAHMIAMVAKNHPDMLVKLELLAIADYFHEQGVLAGDQAWKLPTV